jgi:ABC-type nitrate/sulfonate/bicarbonate transport system substrate-binding protein
MKAVIGRRGLVKGIVAASSAAIFAPSIVARGQTTLRINAGMQPIVNGPAYIALREKYFEKLGLDVNLVKFTSGPAQFAALAGGQVDLGWGGMGAFLLAKANGQDLQSIAVLMDYNKLEMLVVPKDSPIKSMKDVAGKKIAGVQGSDTHYGFWKLLQKSGMSKDAAQFVGMAPPQQVAAFNAGDIDGAFVWAPFVTPLIQAGGRVIARNSDLDPGPAFLGWAGRKPWLQQNSDAIVRLLQGWNMGLAKMQQDPELAIRYTLDFTGMAREQADAIAKDLTYFDATAALDSKSIAYWAKGSKLHTTLDDFVKFGHELGLAKQAISIDDYVLTDFMTRARKG